MIATVAAARCGAAVLLARTLTPEVAGRCGGRVVTMRDGSHCVGDRSTDGVGA